MICLDDDTLQINWRKFYTKKFQNEDREGRFVVVFGFRVLLSLCLYICRLIEVCPL